MATADFAFDEINRAEYEEWYSAMELEDEQLQRRIQAALAFDTCMGATLAWIERNNPGTQAMYNRFYSAYMEALDLLDMFDDEDEEFAEAMELRATRFAEEVTKSTNRHLGGVYWTSADRAVEIAKNESNLVNLDYEYREAKRSGIRKKTWKTMADDRARDSHWYMENVTVGIDEFFNVSGYDMLYPMDGEHGAPPEEIINCRCWLTYS